MRRIPEPELMLDAAQARAYAEADFSEPHDRFVALLGARLAGLPREGTALDLGCGPADVTLRFARAFPGWAVDGVDGSQAMLELGREAVACEGLAGRVRLVETRLPAERMPRAAYDLVFSNSLLHHLEEPRVLWDSVGRWCAPGGSIFVMDLLRPPHPEAARELVRTYAAADPEVLRRDFQNSLFAAYEESEVLEQLRAAGLGHLALEVVSDRHWIAWGTIVHPGRGG